MRTVLVTGGCGFIGSNFVRHLLATDAAVRVVLGDKDGPRTEWIVARAGKLVVGVGDEEFAMKPEMSASERESVALARDEKVARLRALLK